MQPQILRYIWPEGDKTPWRIIQKPQGRSWGPFKILGSQILPVGDFDDGRPYLDEPHRLYRTNKGWRLFYTGRYDPNFDIMLDKIGEDGADPYFVKIARKRRYYATRIEPKYEIPFGVGGWGVASLVGEWGDRHPGWDDFIEVHDSWTNATGMSEVLV